MAGDTSDEYRVIYDVLMENMSKEFKKVFTNYETYQNILSSVVKTAANSIYINFIVKEIKTNKTKSKKAKMVKDEYYLAKKSLVPDHLYNYFVKIKMKEITGMTSNDKLAHIAELWRNLSPDERDELRLLYELDKLELSE
jgi:hypothetical protein